VQGSTPTYACTVLIDLRSLFAKDLIGIVSALIHCDSTADYEPSESDGTIRHLLRIRQVFAFEVSPLSEKFLCQLVHIWLWVGNLQKGRHYIHERCATFLGADARTLYRVALVLKDVKSIIGPIVHKHVT